MGIGIAPIQNILELNNLGYFKNKNCVLEIGSQELHLKYADFLELINNAGLDNHDKVKYKNMDNWPDPMTIRCSSKFFYEDLGFKEYFSLDLNEELNSIKHDYNKPFEDKNFYNKFDLVTDFGSCEHAFNIGEIYNTMHKLCKVGGKLIISQALWGGNGYFLFDRPFFESLAAFNNYKILYSSYIISTKTKTPNDSDNQYHIPMSRDLLKSIDLNKVNTIGVYGVLEKLKDSEFNFPNQYSSLKEETRNHMGFNRIYYKDPPGPGYSYIPVFEDSISTRDIIKILRKRIKKKFF